MVSVTQRISRRCTCEILRMVGILKYHMEVRNMLLFHYYIMKINYF